MVLTFFSTVHMQVPRLWKIQANHLLPLIPFSILLTMEHTVEVIKLHFTVYGFNGFATLDARHIFKHQKPGFAV